MPVEIVQPPASEPLSLDEARTWLRIEGGEDGVLSALVAAARGAVEAACGRRLLAQGWRWRLDRWPPGGAVVLPVSPVTAMTAVTVTGPAGPVAVPAGTWALDAGTDPQRLVLAKPPPLPTPAFGGIVLTGTAGLAATPAELPEPVRHAVRLVLAALSENRGDGAPAALLPPAALALLEPWRRKRL